MGWRFCQAFVKRDGAPNNAISCRGGVVYWERLVLKNRSWPHILLLSPSDKNETASDSHFSESLGDRHLPSRFCHLYARHKIDRGAMKFEVSGKKTSIKNLFWYPKGHNNNNSSFKGEPVILDKRLKAKYLPFWLSDGYSEAQAHAELASIFTQATQILAGSQSQLEFEARIRRSTTLGADKITPSTVLNLLPGIIECAPYEVNVVQLVLAAMSHDGSCNRTKPVMKFFELWNAEASKDQRVEIINRLIETDDEEFAAHTFALYSERINNLTRTDLLLVEKIFSLVDRQT